MHCYVETGRENYKSILLPTIHICGFHIREETIKFGLTQSHT